MRVVLYQTQTAIKSTFLSTDKYVFEAFAHTLNNKLFYKLVFRRAVLLSVKNSFVIGLVAIHICCFFDYQWKRIETSVN